MSDKATAAAYNEIDRQRKNLAEMFDFIENLTLELGSNLSPRIREIVKSSTLKAVAKTYSRYFPILGEVTILLIKDSAPEIISRLIEETASEYNGQMAPLALS